MTISPDPNAHHRWQPAAWLRVQGPDAFNFLQGQFTNDLRPLEKMRAVYGLWLNQKGRVLADSFVVRGTVAEEFWVGSYFSPAAVIRERLESYIIADDVTVADETADWSGVALAGASAVMAVGPLEGFVFAGRRGRVDAVEYVARSIPEISTGTKLSTDDMERARIGAMIPSIPADLGPTELPNEGGLEDSAISYTKGCYLGQEVMARLKSMGQVRRQLLKVVGTGSLPPRPAKLYQGAKPVGELRTAVADGDGFIGLALLSLLNVRREVGLSLEPDGAVTLHLADAR